MVMVIFSLLAALWLWPGGLGAVPVAAPPLAPPGETVRFPYFRVPEGVYLCGEPVPLSDPAVREDLDRELTIVIRSHAQTTMWIKRAHRYLPEVEESSVPGGCPWTCRRGRHRKRHAPQGQVFRRRPGPLAVHGSHRPALSIDVKPSRGPTPGVWRGHRRGLSYLQRLYQIFHDWPLALAAYNCGEARVQKEMAIQGVNSFYHLSLPEETERDIYRLLAAKIVLEDPARYGYDIPADQLYPPLAYHEVSITLAKAVAVRRLAEACGSYYKAFKTLNPWINGVQLPPGGLPPQAAAGVGEPFPGGLAAGIG